MVMPAKAIPDRKVQLTVTVPFNFAAKLDRIARDTGRSRSALTRDAIERVVFADYDRVRAGQAGLGNDVLASM